MFVAFLILTCLIFATPALLLANDLLALWSMLAAVPAATAIMALTIRPGEVDHLLALARRGAMLAAIPAVWMLVQLVPLPLGGNAIWESAANAIGMHGLAHITIDLSATLLALSQYLATAGVTLAAAGICIDRQRAQGVLLGLTIATVVASAITIADVAGVHLLRADMRSAALDCAALGLILSGAALMRVLEYSEMQHHETKHGLVRLALALAVPTASFVVCGAAGVLRGNGAFWFATSCGVAVFVAITAVRRLRLGAWGLAALSTIGVAIALGAITGTSANRPLNPALAFADPSTRSDVTSRMLADAPWAGSGAGTFAALEPIYRSADETSTGAAMAPTAVAQVAVELGWPAVWVLLVLALLTLAFLVRGGMRRGRDYFYSAAGAGAVLVLLLQAFANVGVLAPAPSLLGAALLGLALVQNRSRTPALGSRHVGVG